ncbi:hypothetical protein TIFTF001_038354 [Ficus carica]|uniref:S-locus glycoprotein n=1 Tax=Ficus carica TaxID=3494 RepID=A0AA88JCZ7_FICCA|nr:hypothetical protein TIFTF001_038354 [Ficus carica]
MERTFSLALLFSFISASIFLKSAIAADTIASKQSLNDTETLISANEVFELGFFSPGNSKNKYLGMWYKRTPGKVVWVANRDNPITNTYGELVVSENGNFVLLNQSKSTIWSSNISSVAKSPVFLQLLDSGNLVLRDDTSLNYLWQSFDYPCDTLLPDMKISWDKDSGRERYLTSWTAPDDPSSGDSTYKIEHKELPQLVLFLGSAKRYRTGAWDGVRFTGLTAIPNSVIRPFAESDGHEWSYWFEQNKDEFFATVITVTQSSSVQRLVLKDEGSEWNVLYSIPNQPCNNYGNCGANGICRLSKIPTCECLQGFVPKSDKEWKAFTWTSGCVRRTLLECRGGDRFLHLLGVKLPDLLEFLVNKSMNLEECKAKCLSNYSCTACANSDIRNGGSGCVLWFGDFIDLREFIQEDNEQSIYIKLASSELGKDFFHLKSTLR